jgi:hypothetical protein
MTIAVPGAQEPDPNCPHALAFFPAGSGLILNTFRFGNDCQTPFDYS